jgi:AMP phosphorylase
MQLKLERLNIKIGQHKVLLNIADAKELGVKHGDRIRIRGHESLTAIVDTTDDMIPPGVLGAFVEIYRHFKDWDKPV